MGHVKNIQIMTTEIYIYLHDLSAPIMTEVFKKRTLKYNIQTHKVIILPNP